jgi:hypothetical protein
LQFFVHTRFNKFLIPPPCASFSKERKHRL